MTTDVTVTNSPARQRYEALAEGETVAGFLAYQETGELVVLTHTEVDARSRAGGRRRAGPLRRSTTSASAS